MHAVAINTRYVPIPLPLSKELAIDHTGTFIITSTEPDLGISKGRPIVIAQPSNDDLIFSHAGNIEESGEATIVPPTKEQLSRAASDGLPRPKPQYRHPFQFKLDKVLKVNNSLSDLEYSLTAVYRYNKPEVHFHRQSKNLNPNDYDTIINGRIYGARTVFGKLVNAIPRQNKLEFMLQAMNKFSTIDFKAVPLREGLNFLGDYINKRILTRGRLIVKTEELIRTKLNDLLPASEAGFVTESGQELSLSNQASIFNRLFDLHRVRNVQTLFQDAISGDPAVEERFKTIFQNATWPIDLNYE